MPILDVELIGPVSEAERDGLADRIAEASAPIFDSRPQGTWVKVRFLPSSQYAENAGGPPPDVRPVIVSVLEAEPLGGDALAERARRLADAVALACGRPAEHVHLLFEPAAAGRIAFGGKLRRPDSER